MEERQIPVIFQVIVFGSKLWANKSENQNSETWVVGRTDPFTKHVRNLLKRVNHLGDFLGSLNMFFLSCSQLAFQFPVCFYFSYLNTGRGLHMGGEHSRKLDKLIFPFFYMFLYYGWSP